MKLSLFNKCSKMRAMMKTVSVLFSLLSLVAMAESPDLIRLKKLFDEQKVKTGSEFNVPLAERAITELKKLSADLQLPPAERSEAIRLAGGFEGKIAESSGIRGGITHVKLSMADFKKAVEIDPTNADAYYDYGATIQGMSEKGRLVRKFIEVALKISLVDECKQSLVDLRNTHRMEEDYQLLIRQLADFCE